MIRYVVVLGATLLTAVRCDDDGLGAVPAIAWRYALASGDGGWIGQPGTDGQSAVVETGSSLTAFDAATGTVLWRTQLRQGVRVNSSAVAIAAGRVFTAGGDSVYALSMATGQRLWAFLPDAQGASCYLSADSNAVYFGTRSHRVYALDARTGTVLWNVDVGSSWAYLGIVSGATVVGDTVYVTALQWLNSSGGLRAGHVLALDRRTGGTLWEYVTSGQQSDVSAGATVTGNLVVAGDGYGSGFFALTRGSGQLRWYVHTNPSFVGVYTAPAVLKDRVFAPSQDGMHAVDSSGTVAWNRADLLGATYAGVCKDKVLAQYLMIQGLEPSTGSSLGPVLLESGTDFPTSGFAIAGGYAVVVANQSVYGIRC